MIDSVNVPKEFLTQLLEELYELRGERDWWKNEPRCRYAERYRVLCKEIEELETMLQLHKA